jgi:3-hydroxyisobutyrate dehydrogenase
MESEKFNVGLAGVGDMGSAMAEALLRSGWPVLGYDVRPERLNASVGRGLIPAASLAELASASAVVAVVVDGLEPLQLVMAELLETAKPGLIVVVHTTVAPGVIVDFASRAAQQGVSVVDAAVGGGSEKARLGTMTLMVGGDERALDRCRPVFDTLAAHVFRLGPAGAGMAAKLMNNVVGISSYAMLLEAMKFGAAYGMDEDVITTVITQGWGDSRHARAWGRQDRRRRERLAADAQAYTRMSRDLQDAVVVAAERDVELPLVAAAAELLPELLRIRDEEPQRWRPGAIPPRCRVCNIELAAPFRAAGIHPECRPDDAVEHRADHDVNQNEDAGVTR